VILTATGSTADINEPNSKACNALISKSATALTPYRVNPKINQINYVKAVLYF